MAGDAPCDVAPAPHEPMVVAFSVDPAYVVGAAVVIASIAEHSPRRGGLEIWVVHDRLDRAQLSLLECAAAEGGAVLRTHAMSDHARTLPVRSDYISAATFGRLYLGEILPSSVRRLLYLDCDVLVTGDLQALWETDLGDAIIAAVPEATKGVSHAPRTYEHPLDPGLDPALPYFNAGVVLIDMVRWRAEDIGRRAIEYVMVHAPPLMDQDALNATIEGRWIQLDRMWNVTTFWFRSATRQKRHRKLLERARIVHFVGHRKPWLRRDVWMSSQWHEHLERIERCAAGVDSTTMSAVAATR